MDRFCIFLRCAVLLALLSALPEAEAQNGTVCENYDCQKGECVVGKAILGISYPKCVCQQGWTTFNSWDFLPCTFPNCSFSYDCPDSPAPASAIGSAPPAPRSFGLIDPCAYGVCGNGDCVSENTTSGGLLSIIMPSFECICHKGNMHLTNTSSGVCIPDCNTGLTCNNLDIPLKNSTSGSSPSPGNADNSSLCANVDCQRGSCHPSSDKLFPYMCVCENGWSNVLGLSYLGCSIPNCTISNSISDSQCGHLNLPSLKPTIMNSFSVFNACSWSVCGDGQCINSKSILGFIPSYECVCDPGRSNLLNISSGMCVPDCCVSQCLTGSGNCSSEGPFPWGAPLGSPGASNTPNAGGKLWQLDFRYSGILLLGFWLLS